MSRSPALSGLIVVIVVAFVAGVAWLRSQPSDDPNASFEAMAPVPVPQSSSPSPLDDASLRPMALSELPPPPASRSGDTNPTASAPAPQPVSQPASQPASQPLSANRPRVLDLGAGRCKACIALAPILEELKKEWAGRVDVEFIDVWKNPAAAGPYKIRMIPTQIFYDAQGKEVWRHEGFLPKADFIAKFKEMGAK